MPAQLRFLASDQATVVSSDNLGNIATPGSSTAKKYYVNNIGTTAATGVTVSKEAVGTNDGDDYTQLALDAAGSPGSFGQGPLSLGTINALASTPFWVRIVHPAGLTADLNPRRANIVAAGLTV